ncbi:MAG TPA: SIMPL domain-containing protein [Armatimonadota bacterium]|jgi:hypothetical protein
MKTVKSIVLASLLALAPVVARAQSEPLMRNVSHLISASGRGEVRVKPDVILMSIGVQERGAEIAGPRSRAAKKVTDIVDALKSAGVKEAEIRTSRFSVNRVWEPLNDQNQPVEYSGPSNKGHFVYQVANSVSVRTGLLEKAGEILDAVVKAGANDINGPTFGLKDGSPQEKQALADAVKDARAMADTMAAAAGVKITGLDHLSEQGTNVPSAEDVGGTMSYRMAAKVSGPSTPISAGEVVVTANVTAEYRFE